jgi:TRAP-type C4-dicarboxylate transport system permease small subunit
MDRISAALKTFEEKSLFVLVLVILALVFANVVLRYAFNKTLTWGEELSRFLFVAVTYIGASAGVRRKGHIIVDLLMVVFPKTRWLLVLTGNALAFAFSVLIFVSSIRYAHFLRSVGQISTGLEIPMWLPYTGVILGSLLMCFRFFEAFVKALPSPEP